MKHWVRFIVKTDASQKVQFGDMDLQENIIAVYAGDMFSSHHATGEKIPSESVKLLTPCTPTKYIGLWNNYHALAAQLKQTQPLEPLYFIKGPNAFLNPDEDIQVPAHFNGRVMYEGELGIVIGALPEGVCKSVTPEQAQAHIFGYTCINDVTAVELLQKDPSFPQWARAKSFDTFGPFGPCIATGLDWQALTIKTIVNERERQSYPAADMIISPPQIVSHISSEMTLYPGDIIACGTSLGALPMKPNSNIQVRIEGVGVLNNTFMSSGATR